MLRRAALFSLVLAAVAASAAWAQSAQTLRVSEASPKPGQAIFVAGSGFTAGSRVTLSGFGRQLATPTVNARGAFRQRVVVPRDVRGSQHTITARGLPKVVPAPSVSVRVIGAPPATAAAVVPAVHEEAGTSVHQWWAAGVLFLVSVALVLTLPGTTGPGAH